jgi:hypothetical protein
MSGDSNGQQAPSFPLMVIRILLGLPATENTEDDDGD